MGDYRRVRAWEAAVKVAKKTREVVSRFPRRGYSELRAQMISSAESIAHNIAEGRTATSQEEYNRFLDVAARSASEVASQLDMAYEYGIVPQREKFALMGSIICTRRMIRSLQETIRHRERPLKDAGKKAAAKGPGKKR